MLGGIPKTMVLRLGWTSGAMAAMQVLRLVNNVVLARLLAPPVFGLIMIAYTVKTGIELLSDAGIGQNIVSNKDGEKRDFIDTAWTLQVVRGILLGLACALFSSAIASFFGEPQLAAILPVMALLFVFSGFGSLGRALLQKRLAVVRADLFEFSMLLFTVVTQIGLALITPTVWSLVIAGVLSGAAWMVASYFLVPGIRHRLYINIAYAKQIFHFSKWIFLATAIYFFAWNFDRLYFAKQISLAELGIFAIVRSLTDMVTTSVTRFTNHLLFPTVAAMEGTVHEVRGKLLHGRRTLLLLVAIGLGGLVAVSDVIVEILYDDRYLAAATILPLLLIGVWFAILCTVNDSILLGSGRPAFPAYGNGAKLITYVVGVPLAYFHSGFIAAILVLVAGDIVRYVVLWAFSRRQHLAFGRDDLALTMLFVIALIGFRETLTAIGFTGGMDALSPVFGPEYWLQ